MWNRSDLKARAKLAIKHNYWKSVLVALILMILVGGTGSSTSSTSSNTSNSTSSSTGIYGLDLSPDVLLDDSDTYENISGTVGNTVGSSVGSAVVQNSSLSGISTFSTIFGLFSALGIGIFLVILVIAIAFNIFVCNPIEVGGCRFFIENAVITGDVSETAGVGKILSAFQNGTYKNTVVTLFKRDLFIALWTLLLLIPGIIKSYEYRMIPYLLADNPEMSADEAFRISKEMMDGEKWHAFVLDLSFIGWGILSALTLGVVGIFWVNPYQYATNAELYLELKPVKKEIEW
jgi:hypothetical protein